MQSCTAVVLPSVPPQCPPPRALGGHVPPPHAPPARYAPDCTFIVAFALEDIFCDIAMFLDGTLSNVILSYALEVSHSQPAVFIP